MDQRIEFFAAIFSIVFTDHTDRLKDEFTHQDRLCLKHVVY